MEEFVINITEETKWLKQLDKKTMHQTLFRREPGCHPTLRFRDGEELYHPSLGEFRFMRMVNDNFAGYETKQKAIEKAEELQEQQYEYYLEMEHEEGNMDIQITIPLIKGNKWIKEKSNTEIREILSKETPDYCANYDSKHGITYSPKLGNTAMIRRIDGKAVDFKTPAMALEAAKKEKEFHRKAVKKQ